jgi:hypothetical protein
VLAGFFGSLQPKELEERIRETEEEMPQTAAKPVPLATMTEIRVAAGIVISLYGAIAFGLFKLFSWAA